VTELVGLIEFYCIASIQFHAIPCLSDENANQFPFTSLNGIFQNHSKSTNSIPMLFLVVTIVAQHLSVQGACISVAS